MKDDEHTREQRDKAVNVGHGEGGPARQPGASREENAEYDTAREQRIGHDARGAGGVPVDPGHDVWVAAEGLPPVDGAREPPSSVEPPCRLAEDEELPVESCTVRVVAVPVAGCPCRASARTTAKPAAAAIATARFTALARLRPASILVAPGMPP